MPLSLRRGRVTSVVERTVGLARIEVDGTPCIAYPRLTGPVALGDDVIVNVQARELQLGSGGFDVLYANLTRGLDLPADDGAHVMKLPYTPLQSAVRHVEEDRELPATLAGMPVVCCSVHSQVAPVCAGIGGDVRVAYLQLAGGALPVSLSDAVRALQARGLIAAAVAVGACIEGDAAAVSIPSALAWAAAEAFDAVVCSVGPGIVGTGSSFGHGGVAAAEAANAASALGGSPIVAVRASEADARARHRGVSHHTGAALALCLGDVSVAWPANRPVPDLLVAEPGEIEVDVSGWRDACDGLELSHMGRGPEEEALFFEAAFAAGRLARSRL
ncbi:MAG: DUF3866 family protein [Actinobacteria bacterium]|nr:MAG: DUF3866 family protein [Actinomycetota bacterium]